MTTSLCGIAEEAGRVLVARRNPGGSQGGKWEFPGGKQEAGESEVDALVRELQEELSVAVLVGDAVFVGSFQNGPKTYRLVAYQMTLQTRAFRLTEHQEVRWATPSEVFALDLSDSDRQVAEALWGAVESDARNR